MSTPGNITAPDNWLGRYLLEAGIADEQRLEALIAVASPRIWDAAVASGLTTDTDLTWMLAERFRLPVAVRSEADARTSSLTPESGARKHHVVPMSLNDRLITVATSDPRNFETEQELEFVTGRAVKFEMASPSDIASKLDDFYRPESRINRLLAGLAPAPRVEVEGSIVADAAKDPARE